MRCCSRDIPSTVFELIISGGKGKQHGSRLLFLIFTCNATESQMRLAFRGSGNTHEVCTDVWQRGGTRHCLRRAVCCASRNTSLATRQSSEGSETASLLTLLGQLRNQNFCCSSLSHRSLPPLPDHCLAAQAQGSQLHTQKGWCGKTRSRMMTCTLLGSA
jgi:hypothetical protein